MYRREQKTGLRLSVVAALACAASLGAPPALAAPPETTYQTVPVEAPNPQPQGRWGERSALAGDIDGDGTPDFWISAFQEDVGGATRAGRVYLISGRTLSPIYSVASPEPQSNQAFGFTVAAPGDVNGDGKIDLAVGAYAHDDTVGGTTFQNTGKAWVYDGATGRVLYALANPAPQSSFPPPEVMFSKVFAFGTAISAAGDINGDGRADILVGAPSNDFPAGCGGNTGPSDTPAAPCRRDQGQAFVFSGANGGLLRTYEVPEEDRRMTPNCNRDVGGPGIGTCGFFGFTVQGVGDVDGDGATDHLVQGGTYFAGTYSGDGAGDKEGRIWVFSGKTGALLLRIDNPDPPRLGGSTRIFGLQTVEPGSPGDVNGDGRADIYGNCFSCSGPTGSAGEGRAWFFSGADGSILANLFDPSPDGAGGFAFSGAGQAAGDGFIVGQNNSGNTRGGGAAVFGVPSTFGPTASAPAFYDFLAPVEDRQPNPNGGRFGRTVEAPGDLNGDCLPDYVISAPQTDVGANPDQGRVYVQLSQGPSRCPTPPGQPTPSDPTPPATPTPTPARVRPNLLRPGPVRAVQRGRRIVVRVRGRMVGNRGRRCGGRIKIGTRAGVRRPATRIGRMAPTCRYAKRYSFPVRRLPPRLRPRRRTLVLRILVRYQGNAVLKPDLSPPRRVKVRR
jgi:hypothetical protein